MKAEKNEFSVSNKTLWVMGQTGRRQVDCSRVVGQQQQKNDRRQWHAATGEHREDWRSTSAASLDVSSADQRHTVAGLTSTVLRCSAVKSSVHNDRQFELDELDIVRSAKSFLSDMPPATWTWTNY